MAKTTATPAAKSTAKGVQRPTPVPVAAAQPDAPDGTYLNYPVLASLPVALVEYRDCQLQLAAMSSVEQRRKDLGASIEALLLAAGAKTVTVGALQVMRVETAGRKSISADALLALGVPADVIAQATITGNPSSHVRVTVADEAAMEAREAGGVSGGSFAQRRRSA